MKLFFFVVALGFATTGTGDQRPLRPVDREAMSDEKRCSDFFFSTTFGGAVAEQIIFAYETADGTTKRDTTPRKRMVVQISDNMTWERTTSDMGDGSLFRISRAEYTKAQACLPEPAAK